MRFVSSTHGQSGQPHAFRPARFRPIVLRVRQWLMRTECQDEKKIQPGKKSTKVPGTQGLAESGLVAVAGLAPPAGYRAVAELFNHLCEDGTPTRCATGPRAG